MWSPAPAGNEMMTPPPRGPRPAAPGGSAVGLCSPAVAGTPASAGASEGDFFYADSDADDGPEVVAATPVEAPRAGEAFSMTFRT